MKKSPFKFLDSYSKEDRDIFFGREKEIEELHSRVFESKILVVYGTSGTGKSSLINCGLANKFNDADWLPISIRRGFNINQSLYDSLNRAAISKLPPSKKTGSGELSLDLPKSLRSVYLDHFKPVFLIFDQFEELFIFGSVNEKDDLIRNISKVVDSDLQCRFIFSIREEYLAGITEFERVIPSFLSNRIRIEKMTRQNALRVIEGPCRVNEIEIGEGLPAALLENLNPESPEVELTYLQVYLDRIFRLASAKDNDRIVLTTDLLEKAGDVKDLLGSFLEEQISNLDDPDLGMIVLKSFVSVKGTRQQITVDEVLAYSKSLGRNIDIEAVMALMQTFIKLRILRDKDENSRYELRHDSLAAKIYEKITLVEKELLEIRLFIDNAFGNYEKRQLYLTDDDLKYIAPYEDKLFLNERITRFISQSKKEIYKARRRRQNVMIVATAVLITILSFFTVWAMRERANALDQRSIADQERNTAVMEKVAADQARQEALVSKNLAVENEALAVKARNQSEEARKDAMLAREIALDQRNIAEQLSETAKEQAQIAREEKMRAEAEREKAVAAENEALRLNLLSVSQNLALKSLTVENDPQLAGLLAVQAYNFSRSNGGKPEDPVIYEALYRAFSILDNRGRSKFIGSENEVWTLAENTGNLLSADLDGIIRSWGSDGSNSELFTLQSDSPVSYLAFDQSGKQLFVSYENNINEIVRLNNEGSGTDPSSQILEGYSGPVRKMAFSGDGKTLVTAGRDSILIIWTLETEKPLIKNKLRSEHPVTSVVFSGSDTLLFSQSDGSVILWPVARSSGSRIFASGNERLLSLAWNSSRHALLAGCSDGTLLAFDLSRYPVPVPVRNVVHAAGIDMIVFNSDNSLFATSSWDKTIKIYNYAEFFDLRNSVSGTKHLKGINERTRSLLFTGDHKLVAGISDRSIRAWETSSARLVSMICGLVNRDMSSAEWELMVGNEVPYEKTCSENTQMVK